jgi:predicted RND superfamily exporter protein
MTREGGGRNGEENCIKGKGDSCFVRRMTRKGGFITFLVILCCIYVFVGVFGCFLSLFWVGFLVNRKNLFLFGKIYLVGIQ